LLAGEQAAQQRPCHRVDVHRLRCDTLGFQQVQDREGVCAWLLRAGGGKVEVDLGTPTN
jgi:hypothetical protein